MGSPLGEPSGGMGGGLQSRMAGLPMWGWIAIGGAGGVVVWLWIQHRNKGAATTAPTGTIPMGYDPAQLGLSTTQYETLLSQMRNLQGAESQPGDVGPTGPPGPPGTPAPPTPTPAPVPTPTPTPTAPPPAQQRYVTVTKFPSTHGTLWGIAQDYYGNGAMWPRIFEANRSGKLRADNTPGLISNPNLIYTGWRLIVP